MSWGGLSAEDSYVCCFLYEVGIGPESEGQLSSVSSFPSSLIGTLQAIGSQSPSEHSTVYSYLYTSLLTTFAPITTAHSTVVSP